jgi:hypothetical protein
MKLRTFIILVIILIIVSLFYNIFGSKREYNKIELGLLNNTLNIWRDLKMIKRDIYNKL